MKTKILLTLGLASLALTISGCDDKSTIYPSVTGQIQQEQPKYTSNTSEFDLIKKQTFYDSDAYNSTRSVYVLKDKATGKEYIGVSGIGISERGSNTSGKNTIQDER